MLTREQLELVIQRKKINDLYQWFLDHFVTASVEEYATRCPFLMIQGPTGCGKTATLKWVARDLKIPVREYSETTDITAINYDLAHNSYYNDDDKSVDKRRANRFEHFVINHLRFNPLYPPSSDEPLAIADSEFDSDEDDLPASLRPPPRPVATGVIVLVEAPISFAKSQKILISTLAKMIKTIREIARKNPRRVAIVFENLESEKEVISLPTKFKQAIKMQTIKFNPIIKTSMKKFIESRLKNMSNVTIDKDTMELLINDCDGDLRACLHTLQLLSKRVYAHDSSIINFGDGILTFNSARELKRQKLNFDVNPSLLRDVTRSVSFFHILGKILYQKRLYPDRSLYHTKTYRPIDRPFPVENSTEFLSSRIDIDPKILLAWLHQHYSNFCLESDIEKATLLISHLSDIDTISINSTQTSQFYEAHTALDQLQLYLSIEATVFSLYQDQSKISKSSHKKVSTHMGPCLVKSSVETCANGDLYSFKKPSSLSIHKLMEDRKIILNFCSSQIMKHDPRCYDSSSILIDYVPYLYRMVELCESVTDISMLDFYKKDTPDIMNDADALKLIKLLGQLEADSKLDLDAQHEQLISVIEEVEEKTSIRIRKEQ